MAETDLTHDYEETKDNQRENRRNYVSAQTAYPNAGMTVQNNAGVWDMNGWASPSATSSFVGFLFDGQGNAIGADELDTMVSKAIENGELDPDATPKVCGFSADRDPGTTKTDNVCELELKFYEPRQADGTDFRSYGDRCESPTYVCNNAGGPAWRQSPPAYVGSSATPPLGTAEGVTVPGLGIPQEAQTSPVNGDGYAFGDGDNFVTWHWVVAPAPQDCPAQEPGVSFTHDGEGDPFLAHDLDSYVPATRASATATPSTGSAETYAGQIAAGPIDTVRQTAEDADLGPAETVVDQANAAVEGAQQTANDTQNQTVQDLEKDDRMEPNAAPEANPLEETSRSLVEVDQGINPCVKATTGETKDTADPWVDYIDSQVSSTVTTESLYGNTDEAQDASNDPGPDRFSTQGNVGLFTDNDNDDAYDPTGDPYQPSGIQSAGAYPLIWDIRVDASDGEPTFTEDGSCEFTDNQNTVLVNEAERLGYGPNTGLYQLVYLQEPTEFDGLTASDQNAVYPGGNNIYLLASQSVREVTDDDYTTSTSELEAQVDATVTDLQDWVVANVDGVSQPPDVQEPGEEFGWETDFGSQCTAGVTTGDFNSRISFAHDCQALSCEGDTIVTNYVFEVETNDGTFKDQTNLIPSFTSINENTADFGGFEEFNVWTDVDPFDGDPDRNDDDTPEPQ